MSRCIKKALACCVLLAAGTAQAQTVVTADPVSPLVPPDLRLSADTPVASSSSVSDLVFPGPSPFVFGPYSLDPHFLYRFLYSTGLQVHPGEPTTGYINSFAPGLGGDLGTHWSFDYTPTWTIYTNREFHDSVDHIADLTGAYSQFNWDVRLMQTFSTSHDPLIETAEQTFIQTYLTDVDITHHLNDEISVESNFIQTIRRVDPPPDSNEWDDTNWLHFKSPSGLDSAVGVGLGYLQEHPGSDSEYIQPQVRFEYPAGQKLTLDVHGGEEYRDFLTHPGRKLLTPIYGASATYLPFEETSFTVTADRSVQPSFYTNQVTTSTNWNATLQQRILTHFLFSATAGYIQSDYLSETDALNTIRSDNAQTYGVRLSTTLLGRGTLAVFYNHTQNTSNQQGFSFSSAQEGVEFGFRY
jgi:hypothetical protein